MLTALALAALTAPLSTAEDHAGPDWFEGTWKEVLASAASEQKLVFVDFWADWCGPCKAMMRDTFPDDGVTARLEESFLSYSVDVESDSGGPLAMKYGVESLPTLLFLDAKGQPVDALVGYFGPDMFLDQITRIAKDEGTVPDLRRRVAASPKDVGLHFELAQKLASVGDTAGEAEQMQAIERLDPERRSLVLRRVDLRSIAARLELSLDGTALRQFLAEEKHDELLFEGWYTLGRLASVKQQQAASQGDDAEAAEQRAATYRALRTAWQHVPEQHVASFGGQLAWIIHENREHLETDDLRFGLEVALKASQSAPEDANLLDTLACSYDQVGEREKAIATIRRAIELEPESRAWRERLADFEKPKG